MSKGLAYIMPPMPPMPPIPHIRHGRCTTAAVIGASATITSVVIIRPQLNLQPAEQYA